MAMTTPEIRVDPVEGDQCVVLRGVGWEGYRILLEVRGENPVPRMVYLDGDLRLVSPGHSHERDKERFNIFITEVAVGLRLPFFMGGSMTYRRRKKRGGFEPDQSDYFRNLDRVRNKRRINLKTDPPPDLAVEVVHSHAAAEAVEVSRRLGISEVWVCSESGLMFLVLAPDGDYRAAPSSPRFPFLTAAEIVAWVRREEAEGASDLDRVEDHRRWVRDVLLPRARGAAE